MFFDDPERFTCVRPAHVVVLPERRRSLVVAQENEDLSPARGLDVDMRRLVLPRRGVYINLESAGIVHLDHDARYNLTLGFGKVCITSGCTCQPRCAGPQVNRSALDRLRNYGGTDGIGLFLMSSTS